MKCNKAVKLIPGYIDNSLKNSQRIRLEVHIKNCESCSAEFEAYKEMSEQMINLKRVQAPDDFTSNVINRITAENVSENIFSRLIHSLKSAIPVEAAALLIIGMITFFYVYPFDNYRQIPGIDSSSETVTSEKKIEQNKPAKAAQKTSPTPQRINRAEMKTIPMKKISKMSSGMQMDEEAADKLSSSANDISEVEKLSRTKSAKYKTRSVSKRTKGSYVAEENIRFKKIKKDITNPFDKIIRASASFENAEIITDNSNVLKIRVPGNKVNEFKNITNSFKESAALKITTVSDKDKPGYIIFVFQK